MGVAKPGEPPSAKAEGRAVTTCTTFISIQSCQASVTRVLALVPTQYPASPKLAQAQSGAPPTA